MSELRLMAVHAHPDDESSKGAATTARYAAEGARVMVVTLTGGERGDILNPAMDLPEVHGRIHEIRSDEMAKAAEILGVEQRWLGFVDSGLPEGDPLPPLPEGCFALVPLEESTERAGPVDPRVQAARASPRTTRTAAIRTRTTSAATRCRWPPTKPPPTTGCIPRRRSAVERLEALLQARIPAEAHAAVPGRVRQERPGRSRSTNGSRIGIRSSTSSPAGSPLSIECSKYFAQRDDALRAHATQIDPKASSSPCRSSGSSSSGPPRNSSWPGPGSRSTFPRPTCSPGSNRDATSCWRSSGVLADNAPRDTGPEFGKSSPVGLRDPRALC